VLSGVAVNAAAASAISPLSLHDALPILLLAMLGMILLGWNFNALRLRLLLVGRPMGQGQALGVVMATEFAICATPAGAGGPLTLMALLMRHGLRPAQGTAIYTVEQLGDLLVFACAL